MTQIKIEVPSNDPIALSALGEALQRIAAERTSASEEREQSREKYNTLMTEGCEPPHTINAPTREELIEQMESFKTPKNDDYVVELPESIDVMLKDDVTKREGDLVTTSDVKGYETIDVNPAYEGIVPSNIMEDDVDDTTEQYEAGGGVEDDTLDADGLPWDKRIHSRGKTRLADDTWRLARKPNDKTQEEWDEYVASVKAELKAVQDIPAPSDTVTPQATATVQINEGVTTEQIVDALVTPPVVETEVVTPPTLDEQAVADVQLEGVTPNGDVAIDSGSQATGEPVPAVEPPTSVTAPVADNVPSVSTFQELMKYITSDAAKRGATNDMIKEVLAQVDPSLTAIPLIANRADLIPSFVTKLEARLS